MASQGDRFRRRALSRGYKVDEVDAFLDRVEATLSGEPMGAPVASQEVDDVVFRVRFGGYDEWQVDVYLDRVARQLAELEERGVLGRVASPEFASGRPPRADDLDDIPPRDRDLPGRREAPSSRDEMAPVGPPPMMGGRPDGPPPMGRPDGPPMGAPMGRPDGPPMRPDGPPMGPPMGRPDGPPMRPDGPPPMMGGGRPDPTAPMARPMSSPVRDRDLPPMRDEPQTPPPPSRRPEPPQQRGRPDRGPSVEDDGESFAHLRDDGESFAHLRGGDEFDDPFPEHRRRGTPARGFDPPDRFDDDPEDRFGGPPPGRFDSAPPAPPMRDPSGPPPPPMRDPSGPPPQRPVSGPPTGPMSPPPGSPPRGWQPTPPGGFDRGGFDGDDMTRPIRRFQDEPEIDSQMTQRLRRGGGEDRFMPPPPPVPTQGRIDPERRDPSTPPRGMHDPYREPPTSPRGMTDPDAATMVHPVIPPQDGPSHPAPTSPAYRGSPSYGDEPPTQVFRQSPPPVAPGGQHTPPGGIPERGAANVDYGRRNPYEGRGVFDNPGRHGREEMTTELRAADSPFTAEDLTRLNQLRQAFQPRRFGSGYDPVQVDRMFDGMSANMTGRSPVPLTDRELDTSQFSLVQGGYFEAEVDAALREVRDIFARRGMVR